MTTEERLHNLVDLEGHPGFQDVITIIKSEVYQAAFNMADNTSLSPDQYHFQRGAMWAGRRLIEVVPKIRLLLENELLLEQAKSSTSA
jgi:hypothetical protein